MAISPVGDQTPHFRRFFDLQPPTESPKRYPNASEQLNASPNLFNTFTTLVNLATPFSPPLLTAHGHTNRRIIFFSSFPVPTALGLVGEVSLPRTWKLSGVLVVDL